ncbi:MAG: outer membrane beta-barrel protein [Acidobacteria bacterium]|nr:outer membrane beta-barrel protein [Acidobacteriota bacterium]
MKKTILLGALLLSAAATMVGQESRQDVSISATGTFGPQVNGRNVQMNQNMAVGALVSYRYMVTPRSALELNYSWSQYADIFRSSSFSNARVHVRQQEVTGAYVYTRNYGNFNPFVEAGVGGFILTPIRDYNTFFLDLRQNTNVGLLFGGGVAYELSPSYDIRLQYRAFVMKAPDFHAPADAFKTNRYEVVSMPAIGIAYHF